MKKKQDAEDEKQRLINRERRKTELQKKATIRKKKK